MDEDAIRAELAEVRAQQKVLSDRAGQLRKLLSFPRVTPVRHAWRHHRRYEDWFEEDDLEAAYKFLRFAQDDGQCSPVGVSVGGAMLTMEELEKRFEPEGL